MVRGFVIINSKERFVVTIGTLKSLFIIFPNVTKEVFMVRVYVHKHQKRFFIYLAIFMLIFGGIPLYNRRRKFCRFIVNIWRLKLWNL